MDVIPRERELPEAGELDRDVAVVVELPRILAPVRTAPIELDDQTVVQVDEVVADSAPGGLRPVLAGRKGKTVALQQDQPIRFEVALRYSVADPVLENRLELADTLQAREPFATDPLQDQRRRDAADPDRSVNRAVEISSSPSAAARSTRVRGTVVTGTWLSDVRSDRARAICRTRTPLKLTRRADGTKTSMSGVSSTIPWMRAAHRPPAVAPSPAASTAASTDCSYDRVDPGVRYTPRRIRTSLPVLTR